MGQRSDSEKETKSCLEGDATDSTRPGRNPDFLLIGSMKSGTTTLFEYLDRHPQVFASDPKEPGYFSRRDVHQRGAAWYRSLFAGASPDQLCGEASTCYTRWPHFGDVAGRIAASLPDARLIFIMRNPADRAYSHYQHLMQERDKLGGAILSFEAALEEIPEIVDTSLYLKQIERYLTHFPREQFFFTTLEELRAEPGNVLRELQEFLGLDPFDLGSKGPLAANPSGSALERRHRMLLINRVRNTPGLSSLIGAIPESVRRGIRSFFTESSALSIFVRKRVRRNTDQISPFDPEVRLRLLRRFESPNNALARFLGREIDAWLE
jgi:hypothetical protein